MASSSSSGSPRCGGVDDVHAVGKGEPSRRLADPPMADEPERQPARPRPSIRFGAQIQLLAAPDQAVALGHPP